jgi:uncharacterized protein (TIGR02271 family)
MDRQRTATVLDAEGRRGTIIGDTGDPIPADRIIVRTERGRRIQIRKEMLEERPDGTLLVPFSFDVVEREAGPLEAHEGVIIPVMEERIAVGKRERETGRVRLVKTVREERETVDKPLFREHVDVERVTINRPLEEPVESRYEGDTLIVPVLEEVLYIEKRLMLKEELRITRRRVEERHPEEVTLRKEEVRVERLEGDRD